MSPLSPRCKDCNHIKASHRWVDIDEGVEPRDRIGKCHRSENDKRCGCPLFIQDSRRFKRMIPWTPPGPLSNRSIPVAK